MGSYKSSEHDKLVMAREYINVALKLYSEDENFYSILHLAGAVEQILGEKLQSLGKPSALQDAADTFRIVKKYLNANVTTGKEKDFLNKAKNSVKHVKT